MNEELNIFYILIPIIAAMLNILRSKGWRDEYLAECAVDYDKEDLASYDHYIGAVYVPVLRERFCFNCWLTVRRLV